MMHQHFFGALTRDGHTVWLCCDCHENAGTWIDGSCLVCDSCKGEREAERLSDTVNEYLAELESE